VEIRRPGGGGGGGGGGVTTRSVEETLHLEKDLVPVLFVHKTTHKNLLYTWRIKWDHRSKPFVGACSQPLDGNID